MSTTLSGEILRLASANTIDGAQLDVWTRGFQNVHHDAYFDERFFTQMLQATYPEAVDYVQESGGGGDKNLLSVSTWDQQLEAWGKKLKHFISI